jgi:hypothetical protein
MGTMGNKGRMWRLGPGALACARWGKPRQQLSGRTLPAQSMTLWPSLKRGRDFARCDSGLRLPGWARKSAVQPAEHGRLGNCSLFSSSFHLFPLASAVLIIKIIFHDADACPEGSGRQEPGTRLNSLKLAKTLILKFFLILKRKGQEPKP